MYYDKNHFQVLGPVAPESLGVTLTHEHFSLDFNHFYKPPPSHLNSYFDAKINLANSGMIRQYPYGSKYNVSFFDADTHQVVLDDVLLYKKWGGGTIVENTSHGLKRNIGFMVDVSKRTGVHVIAGTGHYIADLQSPADLSLTVEQMVELYTKEVSVGVPITDSGNSAESVVVRCGFIGEVGSVWPIHGNIIFIVYANDYFLLFY